MCTRPVSDSETSSFSDYIHIMLYICQEIFVVKNFKFVTFLNFGVTG